MNLLYVCPGIQSHITYHIGNSVPSWTESCMTHVLWTETLRFPRSNLMEKNATGGKQAKLVSAWSRIALLVMVTHMLPRESEQWEKVEYGFGYFLPLSSITILGQFTSRVRCQISADGAHVSTAGPWLIITDILKSAADSQYDMYQTLLEYKQELCERMTV